MPVFEEIGGFVRAPNRGLVISMCGDSNIGKAGLEGRPGWGAAYDAEWLTEGGVFYGATVYNNVGNGSTLQNWVDNIETFRGDATNPSRYGVENPWDIVAADPDIIVLSLGTNDCNSPERRSVQGVEATLRRNMATLVNFYLENTRAIVWLKLPQPFHWGEGSDDFDATTQFEDDDEAAANSAKLRTIYNEWQNRNTRVLVYDSHRSLYGYRCDDKSTDCLDEETGEPLIDDGLHKTNLGNRREAQQMAQQWSGGSLPDRIASQLLYAPDDLLKNAVWSETIYLRARSGSTISVELDPAAEIGTGGYVNMGRSESQTISTARQVRLLESLRRFGKWSKYLALTNTTGPIYAWVHDTGNTYTMTAITLSQIVTASDPDYAILNTTGATFVAGDVGSLVTFYGLDPQKAPYAGSKEMTDIIFRLGASQTSSAANNPNATSASYEVNNVEVSRSAGGGALVLEVRERNQTDGRYVGSQGTFATGMPMLRVSLSSGFYRPSGAGAIDWRKENYPSGFKITNSSYLSLEVISGTVTGGAAVTLQYRGTRSAPAITTQPTNQSAVAPATATFTLTATAPSSGTTNFYRWQVSTDSGATWSDISGATATSYTTPATVLGDNGKQYRCILSTQAGGLISSTATLTVT